MVPNKERYFGRYTALSAKEVVVEKLGFKVRIKYHIDSVFFANGVINQTFRNVTEIHYNYPSAVANSVAFESDVHSTGQTHLLSDIQEFEAEMEVEKAEHF
jgi:hypothetical protein